MNLALKAAAKNTAIVGIIFGVFYKGYQTYAYCKYMYDSKKKNEEMLKRHAELMAWPHNAPQEVQDVLYGRKTF